MPTPVTLGTQPFAGHDTDPAGTIYGGYLYLSGGRTSHSVTTTISYSPLNSLARKGQYSRLVNLGSDLDIAGLTYSGSGSTLSYRLATSNGIFGPVQPASSLTGSSGGCGGGSTRYVRIIAELDDTYSATFPDLTTATITDITLSYNGSLRAPTESRLKHGKFFQDESLQQLDTCPE